MGRLHLIIGPPGSGKTRLLLNEIADELARAPLGPPAAPPLVLVVPEQQAAQMERALLEVIPSRTNSRCQVLSFRWLARRLELAAGETRGTLSDTGRRLLVWKLLGEFDAPGCTDANVRNETAALFSKLLGELAECGASAGQLRERAQSLAATHLQLAQKAELLAEVAHRVCEHCEREQLHFTAPPARIPELLREEHWPLLAGTRVWIDGFSSFTPAEDLALIALLRECESVTASLLLDPARVEGPLDCDIYDWYAPTRKQYERWGELAAKADVEFDPAKDVTTLNGCQRWPDSLQIRLLATHGLQAVRVAPVRPEPPVEESPDFVAATHAVSATVHANERAEVAAAAREIRRLVLPEALVGAGLRYGQISVAMRSLAPYADLIELIFAEHGIPCFIDRRRTLAHHPACTLLRCGLRLALGCAEHEDARALLKCGLLGPGDKGQDDNLRRFDLLENYARAVRLTPAEWIGAEPWTRWPEASEEDSEQHGAELAELNVWRGELLAPISALRTALNSIAGSELRVRAVLEQAWLHLFSDNVRSELRTQAAAAAVELRPDVAELHSKVLPELALLLDEVVTHAGEQTVHASDTVSAYPNTITASELCRWLDSGVQRLSIGFPPPRLDSVLVTDIARGRHHEVAATLLLGMADDCWPPPARPSAFISDDERELLNGELDLVPSGATASSSAEPYLALVACTRPTHYLWLSRPAADADGRGRAPSPFYSGVLAALQIEEQVESDPVSAISTVPDLVIAAALSPQDAKLQSAAQTLAAGSPLLRGLQWARGCSRPAPLALELMEPLLHMRAGPPEVDIRQLEDFGSCPYRHYTRHLLKLRSNSQLPREAVLARFYRRLVTRTLTILQDNGYDWQGRQAAPIREAASEALAELSTQLAAQGSGALHQLERASLLIDRICKELSALPAGRTPQLLASGYGSGQKFDPLTVDTPRGQLRVRGQIARVDIDPGGATVVELRLRTGEDALHWPRFLAGQELRLPAALLALRGHQLWDVASDTRTELHPANADLQRIEPHWDGDAASFRSARLRPEFSRDSDNAKVGNLVERTLEETTRVLSELGERLLAGEIAPLPLRHGKWTACASCEMRPVCRFDPAAGEQYRIAQGSPAAIRNAIAAGESFTGSAGVGTSETAL